MSPGNMAQPGVMSGSLSRAPSTNGINKVDMMRSQSTLCRQGLWANGPNGNGSPNGGIVPQGPPPMVPMKGMNGTQPNSGSSSMIMNIRSGRSSAPPSQFRKSLATASCASSSRRGDSTEEDEELESAINSDDENSEDHRTLRPRPVTPPKPNILKQIRRGSSNTNGLQQVSPLQQAQQQQQQPLPPHPPTNGQVYMNGHYVQHTPPSSSSVHSGGRQRRLWPNDTMRSSKSEFNLANIGRDTPVRRRNNSGASMNMWHQQQQQQQPLLASQGGFQLAMTNPTSIPRKLPFEFNDSFPNSVFISSVTRSMSAHHQRNELLDQLRQSHPRTSQLLGQYAHKRLFE